MTNNASTLYPSADNNTQKPKKGRFSGQVALVTGGGTGIGAATARRIAAEDGKVIVTGRRPDPVERVAAETGGIAVTGGYH